MYAQNIPFWPDTKDNVLQSIGHFVGKKTTNASNTNNEGKEIHLFVIWRTILKLQKNLKLTSYKCITYLQQTSAKNNVIVEEYLFSFKLQQLLESLESTKEWMIILMTILIMNLKIKKVAMEYGFVTNMINGLLA